MSKPGNRVPTNPYNDRYSSLIRPIKIFLPSYSRNADERTEEFVGRERLMERLFNWLSNPNKTSVSYLVTGFRGMGKTSLVERVTNRLTRDVKQKYEPWLKLFIMVPLIVSGVCFACGDSIWDRIYWWVSVAVWLVIVVAVYCLDQNYFSLDKKRLRFKYPNHSLFDDENVDKMTRGKKDNRDKKKYKNIKISINLGHEVLRERDVLSLIATTVKDKYKVFVNSTMPHLVFKALKILALALLTYWSIDAVEDIVGYQSMIETTSGYHQVIVSESQGCSTNHQIIVGGESNGSWWLNSMHKLTCYLYTAYQVSGIFRFLLFIFVAICLGWLCGKLFRLIPFFSTPILALRRLDTLVERTVAITGEETGIAPSLNNSTVTFSLFNRRKQKAKPIADIREIETELADIINLINSDKCVSGYRANFIVVFDEMDKIDPENKELPTNGELPEYTDSVKGFPEGMESRVRRRDVLRLLANIKLFVSTARAKFVFISGRELYDAYLADLSDRDFAISSIFSGVINIDSFLTPEGGQTDVRSMSEWYITNRLIPRYWLEKKEKNNARKCSTLKKEMPSLRWYYQYLIEEIDGRKGLDEKEKTILKRDANYVVGFLHTFAAYLTHISNGSPKKIFLYFEKNIRKAVNCIQLNDWGDVCSVGKDCTETDKEQQVLYFNSIRQKTINFVNYLADPIMGTITNDLSDFGDRFLVSLSFIIDHIYKHHNRSFSWRNLEQIPDLLKTSKAPELRDSMMSIMEYLTQIHISPILIGLNEYKFHKSINEEISVMSKLSDEASALFNFTLDESLPVIQHNYKLLNHYIELDKSTRKKGDGKRQYIPIIARIHSNLGDLHYWDEDYYAASLEYRAAIDAFSKEEMEPGFLTRVRCMLKLGLTYESRHLYPNAYQLYCQLMELLIQKRWIKEDDYSLVTKEMYVNDWRSKRQLMRNGRQWCDATFHKQFDHGLAGFNEKTGNGYSVNVDGVITSFAKDLTPQKASTVSALTMFEEVRYLYQAILAKLSILEKMGMSGITQTNIAVAEGEFIAIHKSVNIREKFVISADFFRKLAEILYYKNSLSIIAQNQDSFYASVYYNDYDLLGNLDDYCLYGADKYNQDGSKILGIKHDVRMFFYNLDNEASKNDKHPKFIYDQQKEKYRYSDLFNDLKNGLSGYLDVLESNDLLEGREKQDVLDNVSGYLNYNINDVPSNKELFFYHKGVMGCEHHCQLLRRKGLRPPCYACKYYTRSLRILVGNMFVDKSAFSHESSKSYWVLSRSFKSDLIYSGTNHLLVLAQTLEGFGNVMYACTSGDDFECLDFCTGKGITPTLIEFLTQLCYQITEQEERDVIGYYEHRLHHLSRLDKSILYYWDAYRFYIIGGQYNDAVGVLNKLMAIFSYYVQALCYSQDGKKLMWNNETETIKRLIGNPDDGSTSFISELFRLIVRYTGYKYDHTNLSEITELKWIYSKELHDDIDLTRLSLYPAVRAAWLRAMEIRAKGLRFLSKRLPTEYTQQHYLQFIKSVYPLITPKYRYETTFYEEVLAYYTKIRFNEHVLNNLLGGNVMLNKERTDYAGDFHIVFFEKLVNYLASDEDANRLDRLLFKTKKDVGDRINLVEFLIHDTVVCITNMVKVFTPHNHLTSYSKSFTGIIYNYYWEWSRKYELLYSLYQYHDFIMRNDKVGRAGAERIIGNIAGAIRVGDREENQRKLREVLKACSRLLSKSPVKEQEKYGKRSDQFYGRVRHDIDDITISTIYSNYTAEMALSYYKKTEEANTEGEAYKEMMGSMHFLDDDLSNDTCQFNIACDRFLLNCGVIAEQRRRLEKLYKASNIYSMQKAYINTPGRIGREPVVSEGQFDRSQFINSEY